MSPSALIQTLKGCKKQNLTLDQYAMLLILDDLQDVDCTALSAALACTSASITGRIDRLETRGLLTRSFHKEDRRQIRLCITPLGKQLLGLVETETTL